MLLNADTMKIFHQWTKNVHHRSKVATDRTSWDKPVCTYDTLWRQHFITTSKEYLTNGHILLKYFEFVFLRLHLMKITCKLITIRLSYKRNKKGAFLWNTVYKQRVYERRPTSWTGTVAVLTDAGDVRSSFTAWSDAGTAISVHVLCTFHTSTQLAHSPTAKKHWPRFE